MRDPLDSEMGKKTPNDSMPTVALVCDRPDDVSEICVESHYRLYVRFFDGVEGFVDLSALIASPNAGVFADLRDESIFATATVVLGAITWVNGLDLAPDAMHEVLAADGFWPLQA